MTALDNLSGYGSHTGELWRGWQGEGLGNCHAKGKLREYLNGNSEKHGLTSSERGNKFSSPMLHRMNPVPRKVQGFSLSCLELCKVRTLVPKCETKKTFRT